MPREGEESTRPVPAPGAWAVGFNTGLWLNQHLMKDCGLVPYMLHKVYGFRPAMLGRGQGDYPYLNVMKEMRLAFLPVSEEAFYAALIAFTQSHADEMDLIVLFGAYPFYCGFLKEYRRLRPDGKVYMALDANISWTDRMDWTADWFSEMLGACDVIATSCRKLQRHLNRKWVGFVIDYMPNGFFNPTDSPIQATWAGKEHILLTVGRIGAPEKAHHILLEAFAKVHAALPDWRVHCVGAVEPGFQPYIDSYFSQYPALRDKVLFKGQIEDKAALYEAYAKAKVFVLTSCVEGGMPNVIAEALFHGCYIVTTALDAADEMTDGGRCGRVFPVWGVDALADIFLDICADDRLLASAFERTLVYAANQFDWRLIIRRLYHLLYEG